MKINEYLNTVCDYLIHGYIPNNLMLISKNKYRTVYCDGTFVFKYPVKKIEIDILEDLQEINEYPRVFQISNQVLITKYIQGYSLKDINHSLLINTDWIEKIKKTISDTIGEGILPYDIHSENIMFDEFLNPILIDVGEFEKRELSISDTYKWINYFTDDFLFLVHNIFNTKTETISYQ